MGTDSPTSPKHARVEKDLYLRGRIQFEGWLLSHATEVCPDLLLITLVVRVIEVIVVP